ncbi:PHA/PHB synthase family protein [Paenalcaligenes hominis]|uniref:PHA/PHB synthase family protein n=1 Tax=Paenalcaligenes hominis TaxID=643674 RepID=UPI003523E509
MHSNTTNEWPGFSFINQTILKEIQADFLESWHELHRQAQQGTLGPAPHRRFKHQAWQENQAALINAHLWHLYTETLNRMVGALKAHPQAQERLAFALMQWAEALNPANYLFSNPEALNEAIQTKGQSLLQGAQHFLRDMQKGRMLQTDETKFALGENIAVTPGAVVYENELLQLIQYAPLTEKTYSIPLFIVPPNINKYYILDLQPENSFVRYALEQGMQVYLISWRNPLKDDTDGILEASWGDYLQHGILSALQVAQTISGQKQLNTLGFCVGGTMLASALSLAQAKGQSPAASMTLLTAMLDFHDVGVLGVFVDETLALLREYQLAATRLMPGSDLATTFSFLRPSELVWNYVSSNYLQGKTPPPFDILFWNADSTNLPGPFFTWYFRNTYLENNLRLHGKVQVDGTPIDLSRLEVPVYVFASEDDHIVPWRTAYASTQLLPKVERFVLGASGHIAGVINPPAQNRRYYWAYGPDTPTVFPGLANRWQENAEQHIGSWWPDWMQWLSAKAGKSIAAPKQLGNSLYPELEPAPGRYVKVKAVA